MLTITGPGPLWTSTRAEPRQPALDAVPDRVRALRARRGAPLRRTVDRYLLWNEPNQPGWLQPQNACVRGVCTPVAPHLYRGAGARGDAADPRRRPRHARSLIGELAPIGKPPRTANAGVAPLPFLRALGCVDADVPAAPRRALRAASSPPTRDSLRLSPASGAATRPTSRNPNRDEAQFADLGRLFAVLDRLTRQAPADRSRGADVHLTEFGYQTSPPDHAIGVTLRASRRATCSRPPTSPGSSAACASLSFYQWEDEPVIYARARHEGLLRLAERAALLRRARRSRRSRRSRRRS